MKSWMPSTHDARANAKKGRVALPRETGLSATRDDSQLFLVAKKVRNQVHILVCRVIDILQSKSRFKGLQQREVVIPDIAREPCLRVVSVNNRHDLVGQTAVVVLIPYHHDYIAAFLPSL